MRLVPIVCCCAVASAAHAELTGEVLLETAGRFHPLVVHFPIALLVVAALIEVLRIRKPADQPSDAAFVCLLIGAASAIVGAWSGWMLEDFSPTGDDLIEWHRWLGVGVAGASVVAVFLSLAARGTKKSGIRNAYRLVLLLAVVAVGITGHLGGTMIYGEGFLTDPIREALQKDDAPESSTDGDTASTGGESTSEGSIPAITPPDSDGPPIAQGSFEAVRVIFENNCYDCHGQRRGKGGLRLHERDELFHEDEEDWVVLPGDPDQSLLLERVALPADHDDTMPPEEGLPPAEIEIIRAWIAAGAPWGDEAPKTVDEPAPADSTPADTDSNDDPVGESTSGVVEPEVTGPSQDDLFLALRSRGALAMRLAENTTDAEVRFGLLDDDVTDEDLDLLVGLESTLVSLDLSKSEITDEGVARLASFTNLRSLRLDNTPVTDQGLRALTSLTNLERLNLRGTAVTNDGVRALRPLTSLRKLYVWETEVTPDGAASITDEIEGLEVILGGYGPVIIEPEPVDVPEGRLTFAAHVRPIFESRCFGCHGTDEQKAGLRLDTVEFLDREGDEQLVVPGMPATSEIVKRITMPAGVKGVMPPQGETLNAEQIALITAWIERGAERE